MGATFDWRKVLVRMVLSACSRTAESTQPSKATQSVRIAITRRHGIMVVNTIAAVIIQMVPQRRSVNIVARTMENATLRIQVPVRSGSRKSSILAASAGAAARPQADVLSVVVLSTEYVRGIRDYPMAFWNRST